MHEKIIRPAFILHTTKRSSRESRALQTYVTYVAWIQRGNNSLRVFVGCNSWMIWVRKQCHRVKTNSINILRNYHRTKRLCERLIEQYWKSYRVLLRCFMNTNLQTNFNIVVTMIFQESFIHVLDMQHTYDLKRLCKRCYVKVFGSFQRFKLISFFLLFRLEVFIGRSGVFGGRQAEAIIWINKLF